MERKNLLRLGIAAFVALAALVPVAATATQSCLPDEIVCMGDSGGDLYAHCDGQWVDAYDIHSDSAYAQVCLGYDGVHHVIVCEGVVFGDCHHEDL